MGSEFGIYAGKPGWEALSGLIELHSAAGVYILADRNTIQHCLPLLRRNCPDLANAKVFEIPAGEGAKTIDSVIFSWNLLSESLAMRNSLLLCLGGGVITDMGGFAAATFKRGIHFAHIPTTLLAMVDAAIGGKTGIDVGGLKNQVGLFARPDAVFCFPEFLQTLPARELVSGFAEMIKHALISSRDHFDELLMLRELSATNLQVYLGHSAGIKAEIVAADPQETGLRKVLNLGHTIGHAVETYSLLHDPKPLLHGEAIAVGLVCEAFISMQMLGLPETDLELIEGLISKHFLHYQPEPAVMGEVISLMMNDKKNNKPGSINFTLLKEVGLPVVDQFPGEELIRESLTYYLHSAESR